jgi:hypothetical protein
MGVGRNVLILSVLTKVTIYSNHEEMPFQRSGRALSNYYDPANTFLNHREKNIRLDCPRFPA